jgi:NTP pyrophosphatase (non-canonical NTP hydrolase)
MSRLNDIEDFSHEQLRDELDRRRAAYRKGLCWYCGMSLDSHTCKHAGRESSVVPVTVASRGEFSGKNRTRSESPSGFNHSLNSWSLSDWMTATLGELGEAANIAKKLNRIRDSVRGNTETEKQLRESLRREIGDTGVYLDLLAQSEGFLLHDAMEEVFESKSKQIGYTESKI